jgi:iron complex transport system ATP-binding protein
MTVVAAQPDEVQDAIHAAARLNPLFALSVEPDAVEPDAVGPDAAEPDAARLDAVGAGSVEPDSAQPNDRGDESWLPATCLVPGDPAVHRLVARVGMGIGDPPARVAASMVVLGYSARLVAPTLATLLRDGLLPDVTPPRVCWRYLPGSGFQLRLAEASGWRSTADTGTSEELRLAGPSGWRSTVDAGTSEELRLADPSGWRSTADAETSEDSNGVAALVDLWCRDVVDDHLATVIAAVQAVAPAATGLLWGNVASSLAGALRMLVLAGAASLPAARSLAEALLSYGPLRGTGHLSVGGGQLSFARRSCCLYYTLPGGGMCGDCALLVNARRRL